ncbi:ORF6N domain-containing protein [Agriterribacter sp.]|uniref:ORF6N domain-containing protein n=1 Tax=Agriterribacter sp. TaxID=2821509 RepID=UPI002BB9D11A|nr:ORF6N domain-containing protein [Agriterribacter sp.]HRP56614.1 ORF6N domain-containing protein [Agriterribacter sp.]
MQLQVIQNKIYEIRGQKVMLDFDLAGLYNVETKAFNQAVKRNIGSFPAEFMFQLTRTEWRGMRSQFVTSYTEYADNQQDALPENIGSSQKKRRRDLLPYAFTEHGVTMLASVLKSPTARKMNIAIVKAFIAMRKLVIQYAEVLKAVDDLRERIDGHDAQLNQIYDALENMLDKKAVEENRQREWDERERIGFKK